ncbi:MAG: DMT family transporter [bacterium]|nr:DMT family transporter [bacterium]
MNHGKRLSVHALLVAVFWGLSFVATQIALDVLTPVALVALRLVIGTVAMFAVARIAGWTPWPRPGDRLHCLLLGLILAVHLLIQSCGLLKTTATNTGWIIAFVPITIAVGARLFLSERMAARAWFGIGLGTVGVLVISLAGGLAFSDAKVGDLLQFASCLTWTAYTLLSVGPIARNGSLPVTLASLAVAGGISVAASAFGPWTVAAPSLETVAAVAFLGVVCSGLACWLWHAAVSKVGSTTAGTYLYLEPFVTWAAAAAVRNERLSAVGLIGGLTVLVGVWLVSSVRRTK